MAEIFRKISSIKLPQLDREAQGEDYWREHKGVVRCPRCGNVHFKKRWYASSSDLRGRLKIKKLSITETKFCQACRMIKEHTFEGEIFIDGFPSYKKKELLRLINNFGERAVKIDPQDRIIKIEETKTGYRVTTTENQLAGKLARKIKEVFKMVKVHYSRSPEPAEVSRIFVTFHGARGSKFS